MPGPLTGLRVLELARILAGPWSGQVLADLGADVIKVERKGTGDDTRAWGPPFLKDKSGAETREAGYYLCVNRGKRSITIELDKPEGQQVVRALAARSRAARLFDAAERARRARKLRRNAGRSRQHGASARA